MEHFNRDADGMITTGKINNAHFMPDDKGRMNVKGMTDRELMEEIVTTSRATRDLVESFIADFANNPMMGSLMRMFGGKR